MVASGSAKGQIGPVGGATIEAGSAEQSSALAITARDISKRWGEKVIVENFSTRIFRKDRIAPGAGGCGDPEGEAGGSARSRCSG